MFFNRDEKAVYEKNQTRTVTGNSQVVPMIENENYFGMGFPGHDIVMKMTVTANDAANANETYEFAFQSSSAEDFSANVKTHMDFKIERGKTGVFFFPVPVAETDPVQKYTRLRRTFGGTSPSLSFTAELTSRNREVATFTGPSRAR